MSRKGGREVRNHTIQEGTMERRDEGRKMEEGRHTMQKMGTKELRD
jgi:hypothetical protein